MTWDSSYCFLSKAMAPSLLAAERWPGQTPEGVPACGLTNRLALIFGYLLIKQKVEERV